MGGGVVLVVWRPTGRVSYLSLSLLSVSSLHLLYLLLPLSLYSPLLQII